jgi:queuine tRNA-ribosyltransferase
MIIIKKNNKNIFIKEIKTKHGVINTPCFVPVATNACIKTCDSEIINKIGIDLIFCNTYHLMVHPGENVIKNAGGIHKFMNRKLPIITDSGGFQIFSLMYGGVANELKSKGTKKIDNSIIKINEEGAIFRSYRDGSNIFITPESSIIAQKKIGADIIIPLDELLPFHVDFETFKSSFYKTHRWQIRSLEEHKKDKSDQIIYGVIHGNMYEDFRKQSCKIISELDFDGYAIGGSFGNCKKDVIEVIKFTVDNLPIEKPKHLLGIADLETIKEAIFLGIDSFDSSYPTKCARHGVLFSDNGYIKIQQGKWKTCNDFISNAPIVREYTAAYIHHLFKTKEQTAGMLASIHNIWYLNEFCKNLKK